jgi:hypothetical protein
VLSSSGNTPVDSSAVRVVDVSPDDDNTISRHQKDAPEMRDPNALDELSISTEKMDLADNEPVTNWNAMLSALETGESEASATAEDDDDDVDTQPVPQEPIAERPTADEIRAGWDTLLAELDGDTQPIDETPAATNRIEDVVEWDTLSTEKITDEALKAVQSASAEEPAVDDWDSITRQLDAPDDKDDAVDDWDSITRRLDEE